MIGFIHQVYTGLLSQLSNNSMLSAGAGTVLFGAILAICRNVPAHIFHFFKTISTITFTMHTKHAKYNEIALFINTLRIKATSRTFSLERGNMRESINGSPLSDGETGLPNLILGYGISLGIYRGTLMFIEKSTLQNKNDIDDQITITFLTRNKNVLNDFLESSVKKDKTNVKISVSEQAWLGTLVDRSKRDLNTVFINDKIKEDLIQSIDEFRNNKQWYVDRGIPYKKCIILHGQPGTGKTSLIHAIASKMDMCIRYISDLENISSLFSEIETSNDLIVIEDIDALGQLDRENTETKSIDKKIIHNLLNTFDGLKTPEGMILIMTTNYIDRLDDAIKRSGRIDNIVEVLALDGETMKKMYLAFYGEEHQETIDKFLQCGIYKDRVGADLQQLFLTYSADEVLKHLE